MGLSTDFEQMKKWALSFALCGEVSQNISAMSSDQVRTQIYHKEESPSRIKTDGDDRRNLKAMLNACINPLDNESHQDGALMNIVSGEIAHPDANVDNAVEIGRQALGNFKAGWPDSFYETLKKIIIPMDAKSKHVSIGEHRVYDQELIYARAIGLLASSRELNFDDVLSYELAAYPPSMFSEEGKMRTATAKSSLKPFFKFVFQKETVHHLTL